VLRVPALHVGSPLAGAVVSREDAGPARKLLDAACENARTLSRLCDVLEAGPAPHRFEPDEDGAWILPEEV